MVQKHDVGGNAANLSVIIQSTPMSKSGVGPCRKSYSQWKPGLHVDHTLFETATGRSLLSERKVWMSFQMGWDAPVVDVPVAAIDVRCHLERRKTRRTQQRGH